MNVDWIEVTLGDVIELKRGYDLPQQKRRRGNIPLVSSSGITDYHDKAMAKGPGVITGRYGTIGQVFFVDEDFWPLNTTLYVRDFKGNDPRFISYFLRTVDFFAYSDKAAVPGVNRNHLHQAKIIIPPLGEQRAIAHILGSLDDKIELNRQMNATLEEMARAIFKSWFVDFDPVHAKARGEQPVGMDAATAALFPDSFEDSELGPVPSGWGVKRVGDLVNRLSVGKKYDQKTANVMGLVPILDQGKSGIIGYHNEEPGVIASPNEPVIVFANHTCYMRLITFPFSAIQNVLPFVGSSVDTIWLYYATYGKQPFIEYKGHWPDFVIHQLPVAPQKITELFADFIKPLIKKMVQSEQENRTLAELRDTLLPKLMSGELRVPEAAEMAEAVAWPIGELNLSKPSMLLSSSLNLPVTRLQ